MDEVRFLSPENIRQIHAHQIAMYGGSLGVRDEALLLSAIAMPEAGGFGDYYHSDIYQMAAAYLFHIVQNHPVVDGNKRTGAMAAMVFLRANGLSLESTETEFEELVIRVAVEGAKKDEISNFFREHTQRRA